MRRIEAVLAAVFVAALASASTAQANFVNFETGQVRPLALSPDGSRLFAINTPDNRLEIFDVAGGTLAHQGSVEVGLEPSAVAARTNDEVWVVNHLSDSVSIVDVSSNPPRVTRTLLTCDEPRDILFAGGGRAFITAARRGQNCPVAANLTTPGIGRALVQVFDGANPGAGIGGTPIANIVLFGDSPRPLATDGNTVWAGIFHSGNRTTAVNEQAVCDGGPLAPPCNVLGFSMPGGLPAPTVDANGELGPEVGLIVRFDPALSRWKDELGRNWNNAVRFSLPDQDVFAINANANPPVATGTPHVSVGTVLFNMAVNPQNGKIYVSNTEARNEVRFEGPGENAVLPTVQGHLHEARITVLDGTNVIPRHLNKHIDYGTVPSSPATLQNSLATPTGMAVSSNGSTLYLAAFGSNKVGVFSTAQLEANSFVPSSSSHIQLSGGGPSGLVLDEARDRLYVLTRFDNSISVINTDSNDEIDHFPIYNPEPAEIVDGRPFLYDATLTSSNGEASCASCHIFGDLDSLGWDLGDPDGTTLNNPLPFRIGPIGIDKDFHPLKGPMTTQTLRGMGTHGSMHWRGDRTGGNDPGGSVFDEDAAFKKFNPAFPGLIGRASELTESQMQSYTDFILTVTLPPNPVRNLDNSLNGTQGAGDTLYNDPNEITDTLFHCEGCHTLNPANGAFGADGFATFETETQMFKVAHLRNAYSKVGMFGMSPVPGTGASAADFPFTGNQIRGFGYLHDGSVDTLFRFLSAPQAFQLTNAEQQQLEQFVFAFPSDMAPIVGQQITLAAGSPSQVGDRVSLLIARANANECDLVVKGTIAGERRGAVYTGGNNFQMDREAEIQTDAQLRTAAAVAGQELTYTCVPPGSGERIGIDRDEDGVGDRDELDAGTNPADPNDYPGAPVLVGIRASTLKLRDDDTAPINSDKRTVSFKSSSYKGSPSGIVEAPFGGEGDPTIAGASGGGAELTIYQVGGSFEDVVTLVLPAEHWAQIGTAAAPGYLYRDSRRDDGPITKLQVRKGVLTFRGKGGDLYGLENSPQGTLALRLRLGTGTVWCAQADARTPGSKFDTTARFDGVKYSDAIGCPPIPQEGPTPTPTPPGSAARAFLHGSSSLID